MWGVSCTHLARRCAPIPPIMSSVCLFVKKYKTPSEIFSNWCWVPVIVITAFPPGFLVFFGSPSPGLGHPYENLSIIGFLLYESHPRAWLSHSKRPWVTRDLRFLIRRSSIRLFCRDSSWFTPTRQLRKRTSAPNPESAKPHCTADTMMDVGFLLLWIDYD